MHGRDVPCPFVAANAGEIQHRQPGLQSHQYGEKPSATAVAVPEWMNQHELRVHGGHGARLFFRGAKQTCLISRNGPPSNSRISRRTWLAAANMNEPLVTFTLRYCPAQV